MTRPISCYSFQFTKIYSQMKAASGLLHNAIEINKKYGNFTLPSFLDSASLNKKVADFNQNAFGLAQHLEVIQGTLEDCAHQNYNLDAELQTDIFLLYNQIRSVEQTMRSFKKQILSSAVLAIISC